MLHARSIPAAADVDVASTQENAVARAALELIRTVNRIVYLFGLTSVRAARARRANWLRK
jgi:hypothetical protein